MIKAQLTRMRKYKSFFSKIRNKRGLLTFITFIQIELVLLNCSPREESWECLGLQDRTSQSQRKSILNIHWKDWCWSWSSNPLAAWCKELTHWKRPWCWERLKGATEGEMVGRHHWLKGHEFEQTQGDSGGQRSRACCSPWGCKESDMT